MNTLHMKEPISVFTSVGVGPKHPTNELPIWIGGSGPAAWRRVGERGDGYIPMGNGERSVQRNN